MVHADRSLPAQAEDVLAAVTEAAPETNTRLRAHLREWLGAWPPAVRFQIVGSPARQRAGWDGHVHRVIGISDGRRAVMSVAPDVALKLHDLPAAGRADAREVARAAGQPEEAVRRATWSRYTFRWTDVPADLGEPGVWLPPSHPSVPEWLRPFNGDVLVALDARGRVRAGVGRKQHTRYGHELAVVTEGAHRGRGLARALVAQMARRVIADGAVALYFHSPDNRASARVADAAGFPDLGWQLLEA